MYGYISRYISSLILLFILINISSFTVIYSIDHDDDSLNTSILRSVRLDIMQDIAPLISKGLVFRDISILKELMIDNIGSSRIILDRGARFDNAKENIDDPAFMPNKRITRDTPGFFPFENEPSIAVNKRDPANLVMASHDFNSPEGGIAVYRSYDGGNTWLGPVFLNPTYGFFASDPVVASNRSGFFFVTYLSVGFNSEISLGISGDGGATWLIVRALNASIGYTFLLNDKPWMDIGPDPKDPERDIIYISYTEFKSLGSEYEITIKLIKSRDGGLTFSEPINISQTVRFPPYFVQGSTPAVADDGTLYIVFHGYQMIGNETKLGIWVVRSDDGGETFTQPILVAETPIILPFFGGVYGFRWGPVIQPFIDTGPNGEVYIIFEADPDGLDGPDMADIFFTKSLDRGETWSPLVRLNDDQSESMQFFPSMVVDSKGVIHVVWGDKRNDPWGIGYDLYYTFSIDGGASWSRNIRVTDITIDPLRGIPFFIGDYFDIDASNDSIHIVWTDSRRGAFTPVPAAFGGSALNQDIFYTKLGVRDPPRIEVRSDIIYEGFNPIISIEASNLPSESFVSVAVDGYTILSNVQTDINGRLSLTILVPSSVVDEPVIQIYNPLNGEIIASISIDLDSNPIIDTLNLRIDSVVDRLNKLIRLYNDLSYQLDEVSKDLGSIEDVVTAINATLVGFQNNINSTLALIKTDIGFIARDIRSLNATIIGIADNIVALRTSLGMVITDLSLIKAELSEVRGDIGVVKSILGESIVKLSDIVTGIQQVSNDLVVIRTELGDLNGRIIAISDGIALIETSIGTLSLDLSRYNESISNLIYSLSNELDEKSANILDQFGRNATILFILINIWGVSIMIMLFYIIARKKI